jgi:hypothetical protein
VGTHESPGIQNTCWKPRRSFKPGAAEAEHIRNHRGMLRVQDSLIRRAHACVDADGGHFEHLL